MEYLAATNQGVHMMFVCTVRTRNRTQLLAPIRFGLGATAGYVYSWNCSNFSRYDMFRQVLTFCYKSVYSYNIVFIVNHMLLFYSLLISAFKAQWSLYVPPDLTLKISAFCPHSCIYVFCVGSQNKQPLFLYTTLTDWFL